MRRVHSSWLLIGLVLLATSSAWGQAYPTRPVRVIVSAAAGGPSDVIGRIVAQKLGERFGQQFYVENIPIGAGNVAVGMVAKAAPDGYTLLSPTSSVVINPSLFANLPYDTLRDFAPVTLVAASPHVLTVNPSVPARNVRELIALVRANPGQYSYASPGTGTTGQLAGELFKLSLGLDLIHVPFNGAAPAVLSTIGGHTPIMFTALPSAAANIKDGKLRALAVTSAQRDPEFPDVPTLTEAGVPDQVSEFIACVLAPAGTPKPIVDKLQQEIARMIVLPDVKERLAAIGFTPVGNTPEAFAVELKAEVELWGKVIRDAKIPKIE
ncbi:MAG TPA: tripartite tricarboxylate transporter substrate binding protein [Xanthobacteraceae bacterium]